MKDQPLPLNSAVDLWPWGHFSLGFLTSFGRLSLLKYEVYIIAQQIININ